jgi:hypothetical protein
MNPPKVEVLELEKLSGTEQKYTVQRNLDMIRNNNLKSFMFNAYAHKSMHANTYFGILYSAIAVFTGSYYVIYLIRSKKHE